MAYFGPCGWFLPVVSSALIYFDYPLAKSKLIMDFMVGGSPQSRFCLYGIPNSLVRTIGYFSTKQV